MRTVGSPRAGTCQRPSLTAVGAQTGVGLWASTRHTPKGDIIGDHSASGGSEALVILYRRGSRTTLTLRSNAGTSDRPAPSPAASAVARLPRHLLGDCFVPDRCPGRVAAAAVIAFGGRDRTSRVHSAGRAPELRQRMGLLRGRDRCIFTLDVGWSISDRITVETVVDALEMARWRRRPSLALVVHADREVDARVEALGHRGCARPGSSAPWAASHHRSRTHSPRASRLTMQREISTARAGRRGRSSRRRCSSGSRGLEPTRRHNRPATSAPPRYEALHIAAESRSDRVATTSYSLPWAALYFARRVMGTEATCSAIGRRGRGDRPHRPHADHLTLEGADYRLRGRGIDGLASISYMPGDFPSLGESPSCKLHPN